MYTHKIRVCLTCVLCRLLSTLEDARRQEERRSEACHAMPNQAKSSSSLSFVSLSKPRRCPGGRLGWTSGVPRVASGPTRLTVAAALVFIGELAEMGVSLSKYRVIQSCLDIHYVLSPTENGKVGVEPSAVQPPPPPPRATSARRITSAAGRSANVNSKPPSGNACDRCPPNRGSIISRMSTESVAIDVDSVRSLEHTHTVNCWTSGQPEDVRPSGIRQKTAQKEEEEEEEIEECAVCSSSAPVAIYVSDNDDTSGPEDSLVVQIHAAASDDEDSSGQFARPYRPDRALFQLPQAVRLESSDGYCWTCSA